VPGSRFAVLDPVAGYVKDFRTALTVHGSLDFAKRCNKGPEMGDLRPSETGIKPKQSNEYTVLQYNDKKG